MPDFSATRQGEIDRDMEIERWDLVALALYLASVPEGGCPKADRKGITDLMLVLDADSNAENEAERYVIHDRLTLLNLQQRGAQLRRRAVPLLRRGIHVSENFRQILES